MVNEAAIENREKKPHIICIITVVHFVRLLLTGTIVAEFWACGSLVGIGLCTITYYCVQYCGLLGAPLSLYCNGPTYWQCSQAYMFDLVCVHVTISFGDCSISRVCPKYWAVPHRSARAQQLLCPNCKAHMIGTYDGVVVPWCSPKPMRPFVPTPPCLDHALQFFN